MLRALVLCIVASSACASENIQSTASYEAAVRDDSTSPGYVMVTIVNANTGAARTTCTTANLLVGAIHRQYGLDYNAEGVRQARELTLAHTDHRFTLSAQAALRNFPESFSPEELDQVRSRFARLSPEELREGFSSKPRGKLHEFVSGRRSRDAAACALIGRGLAPYVRDRSGSIALRD